MGTFARLDLQPGARTSLGPGFFSSLLNSNESNHATEMQCVIQTSIGAAGHQSWPMWGSDPQRTGCMDCGDDLATRVRHFVWLD